MPPPHPELAPGESADPQGLPPALLTWGRFWGPSCIPGASHPPPTQRTTGDGASARRRGAAVETGTLAAKPPVPSTAARGTRSSTGHFTAILYGGLRVPAVLVPELQPHGPGSPAHSGAANPEPPEQVLQGFGETNHPFDTYY